MDENCNRWDGKDINQNNFCVECGATSWKSCICLRSADPEMDEIPMEKFPPIGTDENGDLPATGQECVTAITSTTSVYCKQHGISCCPSCELQENGFSTSSPAKQQKESVQRKDPQTAVEDLAKFQLRLEEIKNDRNAIKQNLDQSCLTFLHQLKSFRNKFNNLLDSLEQKAMAELNKLYETCSSNIQSDIGTCNSLMEDLQQLEEKFRNLSLDKNGQQLHVSMATADRKIAECMEMITALSQSESSGKFDFDLHPSLQAVNRDINSLGKFVFPDKLPTHASVVGKGTDHNIRLENDTMNCCVAGMCQLSTGFVLLADRDNKSLKYLDTRYEIVDDCYLAASPRCVCSTGTGEAAVALSNSSIQLVSTENHKLRTTRSLQLNHECWGLACHGDKLYVSDWGSRVYVYTTRGTLIHTVYRDLYGKNIFSSSRHIAVSHDGRQVFVADRDRGLVIIDDKGTQLSVFTHPNLKMSHGVCVDKRGNVYISGSLSHNIILYSGNGETQKFKGDKSSEMKEECKGDNAEIISKSDGIVYPGSIWFDNVQSKLLVASFPPFGGCEKMKVFKFS